MTRIAFIDLETTGLPQRISYNKYYPYTQSKYYNSSRILQIAVVIVDYNKVNDQIQMKLVNEHNYIIKPDNFDVKNTNIHGITEELAREKGIEFKSAIDKIQPGLLSCNVLVAHNIIFDKTVFLSELHRYRCHDLIKKINSINTFCTSEGCILVTKIPLNDKQYKQPKLSELYLFLFGKEIDKLHDALADAKNTMLCFNDLLNKSMININYNHTISLLFR